jgi:hypothetical protein
MFATIKNLIPEPRRADQPRHYVGRHRHAEPVSPQVPVTPSVSDEPAGESTPARVAAG